MYHCWNKNCRLKKKRSLALRLFSSLLSLCYKSFPFRQTFYLNCQLVKLHPWKPKTSSDTETELPVATLQCYTQPSMFPIKQYYIVLSAVFNNLCTKLLSNFVTRFRTYSYEMVKDWKVGSEPIVALDFSSAFVFCFFSVTKKICITVMEIIRELEYEIIQLSSDWAMSHHNYWWHDPHHRYTELHFTFSLRLREQTN